MRQIFIGMIMAAALVLSPVMMGCKSECDKQCDKFAKCMKDMGVKGKKLKQMKKECPAECKKDKAKFKKTLKQLCSK